MLFKSVLAASTGSLALAATPSFTERLYSTLTPSLAQVEAAAANATVAHFDTNVQGSVFNRFVVIWLENMDFEIAAANPDLAWLAQYGVTLSNYWAVTHPSEPNYIAAVGGSYFGLGDDTFINLPSNISTVADLLDAKNISWGEYQEHIPYAGYQGYNFSNQETFANDYMRKHNPLMSYESVTQDPTRLSKIKSFVDFENDLQNEALPQWMFITPNMTNDGHDTNINVSGHWARSFLEPLLSNEYFMKDTLVMLSFDETETYPIQNKVFTLLLGGVIPESLYNTTDDTFYDHYSEISTVEANWNLNSLGRGDVDANVFEIVASQLGLSNAIVNTTDKFNNHTADGYIIDNAAPLPAPQNLCMLNRNGKPVLPAISSVWASEFEQQFSTSCASATAQSYVTASANTLYANLKSAGGQNFPSISGSFTSAAIANSAPISYTTVNGVASPLASGAASQAPVATGAATNGTHATNGTNGTNGTKPTATSKGAAAGLKNNAGVAVGLAGLLVGAAAQLI